MRLSQIIPFYCHCLTLPVHSSLRMRCSVSLRSDMKPAHILMFLIFVWVRKNGMLDCENNVNLYFNTRTIYVSDAFNGSVCLNAEHYTSSNVWPFMGSVYLLNYLPWHYFHLSETPASFSMGWAAFMCISPNVKEEGAMKEDTGTQDTPYTEVSV